MNKAKWLSLLVASILNLSLVSLAQSEDIKKDSRVLSDSNDEPDLIQLYTQDELNRLIRENKHLERVKLDECQFTRDIKDRALVLQYPAYLYLWADMNLTDTCIKGKTKDAISAMKLAASKGMPIAIYRLGQFYLKGEYLQQDYNAAYRYTYLAASLGYDDAKLQLVALLATHEGNEADYETAYGWLYGTTFNDKKKFDMAKTLLSSLEKKMPPSLVAKIRARNS